MIVEGCKMTIEKEKVIVEEDKHCPGVFLWYKTFEIYQRSGRFGKLKLNVTKEAQKAVDELDSNSFLRFFIFFAHFFFLVRFNLIIHFYPGNYLYVDSIR